MLIKRTDNCILTRS